MRLDVLRFKSCLAAVFALGVLLGCSRPEPAPSTETRSSETRSPGASSGSRPDAFLVVESVGASPASLRAPLPGRLDFRPQAFAALSSPLTGRVLSIDVRPGESVKAGAALLTLQAAEASAARAAVSQAQARLASAEDLLRRQTEMLARGVGLEVEQFAAQTAVREARTELDRAQRVAALIGSGEGDHYRVRAPSEGVVLRVNVGVGAIVSPGGEPLVEVGDPRRLWAVIDIPEGDLAGVTVGRSAQISVPALDARLAAVVEGVGPRVDGTQRRVPVYLALKESLRSAVPGMLVEVRFSDDAQDRITLPPTAVLIKDGSRRLVYVQTDSGSFEPRPVRTGGTRDGRVTILEGLKAGERVVVRGALLLDGQAELAL